MDVDWLAQLPLQDITQATPVGGGDVNEAFKLETQSGPYFLLVQPGQPASFYAGEIAGLRAFADAQVLAPRVIANGTIEGAAYLILTYLTTGRGSQADLGSLVAKLHSYVSPTGQFGFSEPYAGTSVSFANPWSDSWADLFIHQRLDVLARALTQKGRWNNSDQTRFAQARAIISARLAHHHSTPVLLHGDLWQGNYMFTADGQPALIDPAAWYGDREFDIGITTVFGGFSPDFYAAYQRLLPFDDDVEVRLNFYRLYYLMVHLDKFGPSYLASVRRLLEQVIAAG